MKSAVLLFTFILPLSAFSQSTLEPNNPAPRVGDLIEVNVHFEKEDLGSLEKKAEKTASESKQIEQNRIAMGTLRLAQTPTDTGEFVVGPMSLTFNGQVYTTQKLVLNVSPALPEKVTDGIWIRTVSHGEHRYLIIEQRIANQLKKQDDGNSITLSSDDVTFAEFDRDKLEGKGLEIVSSSSASRTQQVDKKAGFGAGTSSYRISIFRFESTPMFKSGLRIDKKFFSDLPKNVKLPEVVIL
jgi:hypothetical protein